MPTSHIPALPKQAAGQKVAGGFSGDSLPGATLGMPRGWGWESWFLWPYSVIVTMHELKDSSQLHNRGIFSPPYFRSWYHLACFSCIVGSGLEVSSGLASQLCPSGDERLGKASFLICKIDLDPTLPACLPARAAGKIR